MRSRLLPSLAFLAVAALTACQQPAPAPQAAGCPVGTDPWQRAELFFGRNISGGGRVSDADWQGYVDEVLSPTFPDGLSVVQAEGRWLSPTGERFVEDSFVVYIYLPADVGDEGRIDKAVTAYKTRFQQETVLFSQTRACLAFK